MKTNTVDTVIQDFRDGQNIFRRPSVELMIREISRLQAENERLKEVLQYIRNRNYAGASFVARQALNGEEWEVTK